MSFIYFFPNRQSPLVRNQFTDADREHGVADVLRDASLASLNTLKGPDGGSGLLVMIDHKDFGAVNLNYDADKQNWAKVSDYMWIGYWQGKMPGPELLLRPKNIGGEEIEINDQKWTIPICGPQRHALPTTWRFNGSGEWSDHVSDDYRSLMVESEKTFEELRRSNDPGYDHDSAIKRHAAFCARMLTVNYHVGRYEISILGVLTDKSIVQIIRAAIGQIAYEREVEREKQVAATVQAG
jgi:hypothetical protein